MMRGVPDQGMNVQVSAQQYDQSHRQPVRRKARRLQSLACSVCSGHMLQKALDTYLGITICLGLLPCTLFGLGWLAMCFMKAGKSPE